MKNRWFVILALLLTLGLVLAACQTATEAPAAEEEAPAEEAAPAEEEAAEPAPTEEEMAEEPAEEEMAEEPAEEEAMGEGSIWVLLPDSASSARWETDDRRYFSEYFDAAGIEYNIVNAEGDARTQQTQFEQAITAGAKVILLVNLDSGSAAAMIASARDAGVAVVDYDRLTVEGPGADVYVSFDNVQVGAKMAEVVVPLCNEKENPNVVLLNGGPTDNNSTLFREGYYSAAEPYFEDGSWNLVDDQWVPDWDNQQALVIFEQILTAAENEVDCVFAANDGLAQAVISAFKSAGIDPGDENIPISGQDATVGGMQNVVAGDQAMSVYKPIQAEAEAAAEAAIALFRGEDITELSGGTTLNNGTNDIPFIGLTPIAVTRENMADTVIADGFRTWEEICVGEFESFCAEVQEGAVAEEEATPEPEEEAAAPLAQLAAESCDYGGKILSITAIDPLTVEWELCKPDPAFLAKMAFIPFGIQPKEWLEETGGTGELLERPIGTGPYSVQEWIRGDQIIFNRFDDYWGDPAPAETAVLRWNQDGAARLLELQSGSADFITNIGPDDFDIVRNDSNLQLLEQNIPNILYFGFTRNFAPFDDINVRQAIAMGIDRQRIVDNFFPEGSEVASHFTPCSIPNGCEGEEWYEFDPEAARQMLADAGYPDGFETTIYYRDVFRDYLPEPNVVAVELQTQLADNLGITADIQVMESGEFIAESQEGNLDGIHLLGWSADYPHVTNFLDFHFGRLNTQFGDSYPEIYEPLEEGGVISDPAEAAPFYAEANNAIKEQVPMIPVVHSGAAFAALASVEGAYNPPFGAEKFYLMDPGKDTFVEVQANEPISLYCPDESDGESLRPCTQVVETLYEYQTDSGDVSPLLATECVNSEDGLTWTCGLREGVMFHDGSELDAEDVVATWSAALDASSPLHTGNTGTFFYYSYLWDGLMNAPEGE